MLIPVESVQPVVGSDPQEAGPVLDHRPDHVIGQTIFSGDPVNQHIAFLAIGCQAAGQKDQQYVPYTDHVLFEDYKYNHSGFTWQ